MEITEPKKSPLPGDGKGETATAPPAPLCRMPMENMTTPALAYLGDCVVELCVRTYLVSVRGFSSSAHLNRASLDFVRASAQSEAMNRIEPVLTEEEHIFYRRGRNIGHTHVPKSASPAEYRRATGMEVLFACLYLTGQEERIDRLFRIGYGLDGESSGNTEDSVQAFADPFRTPDGETCI